MFGKKTNEDYEDYNEKYASKYDDDYVAPSHEYREECDHSHEQSYSNINEVRDCDHSHEQTYEDADTEQKPYDKRVSLENSMEKLLAPNEHLLWAGGTIKAFSRRSGMGTKLLVAGLLMFLFGDFITMWMSMLGVLILTLGICLMVLEKRYAYAVTDIRVIAVQGGKNISIPLGWIQYVSRLGTSDGLLKLNLDFPVNSSPCSRDKTRIFTMYKISDAPRVQRIIEDASVGARINKM
ncbi:hypothetical protein [Ruminococcus sp.]|uniref:hypothetical protein n=1 Tax=Ruminococcus sp. TaxID=41978 RepID=UPI0025F6D6AB|nr:hypothetical protein [Ruminococcus sp.]MBQ6252014.1 hypothetical protein [Ruminococcus sp.]